MTALAPPLQADSADTPPGAPARWLRPPPLEGQEGQEASSAVDPGDWHDSPRCRAVERRQWLAALLQRVAARGQLAGPPAQPPPPQQQRFNAQLQRFLEWKKQKSEAAVGQLAVPPAQPPPQQQRRHLLQANSAGIPRAAPARCFPPLLWEGREGRGASSAVDPGDVSSRASDWYDSPSHRVIDEAIDRCIAAQLRREAAEGKPGLWQWVAARVQHHRALQRGKPEVAVGQLAGPPAQP
eukprot:SM007243S21033  [mRNA]  locus=s7243:50:763:+ [translate_table: standard]